jgi:hypothetical protein
VSPRSSRQQADDVAAARRCRAYERAKVREDIALIQAGRVAGAHHETREIGRQTGLGRLQGVEHQVQDHLPHLPEVRLQPHRVRWQVALDPHVALPGPPGEAWADDGLAPGRASCWWMSHSSVLISSSSDRT